jgi:hypothetical protein
MTAQTGFRDTYMEGSIAEEAIYGLGELESLPTLTQGQADDLKIDGGQYGLRIWLSRCGIEDGEPCNNKVTIEEYDGRRWNEIGWYEAV